MRPNYFRIITYTLIAIGTMCKAKYAEDRTGAEKQEDFKRLLSETIINLQRIEAELFEAATNPSEAG